MPVETTWIDILPPQAPPAEGTVLFPLLVTAVVVLAVLACGLFLYKRQTRSRALHKLLVALGRNRLQGRAACCRARRILFERGAGKGLQHRDGQQLREQLNACCFAAEEPAPDEAQVLVRRALSLLKNRRSMDGADRG
jgi:hypothetical protein